MVNVKVLETTEKLKEENENLPYSHLLGPLLVYVALRTFVIATTFLPDPCICPQSSGRLPPRARGFSAIRGRPCSHKASKAPHSQRPHTDLLHCPSLSLECALLGAETWLCSLWCSWSWKSTCLLGRFYEVSALQNERGGGGVYGEIGIQDCFYPGWNSIIKNTQSFLARGRHPCVTDVGGVCAQGSQTCSNTLDWPFVIG